MSNAPAGLERLLEDARVRAEPHECEEHDQVNAKVSVPDSRSSSHRRAARCRGASASSAYSSRFSSVSFNWAAQPADGLLVLQPRG
jgi:hypothetical protein